MNIVKINSIEEIEKLKNAIEVLETKEVEKNIVPKFIKINKRTFDVNTNEFKNKEMIREVIDVPDAVVVVPVTTDNNIILTLQVRPQTEDKILVELPAGYVSPNEPLEETAKRELTEETGYDLTEKSIVKKISSYMQDQGKSSSMNHSYLITELKQNSEQNLDKDETIPYIIEASIELTYELLQKGLIKDANSRLALLEMKDELIKDK